MFPTHQRKVIIACFTALAAAAAIAGAMSFRASGLGRQPSESGATDGVELDALEWDFGSIQKTGGTLVHVFTVTNRGTEPIEIRPSYLGCSCLAVDCPEIVPPGGSAPIRVELELRGREGAFATKVGLTTTPGGSRYELRLSCYAEPRFVFDPPTMLFDNVRRGDTLVRDFRVLVPIEEKQRDNERLEVVTTLPGARCDFKGVTSISGTAVGLPRIGHNYTLTIDTSKLSDNDRVSIGNAVLCKRTETKDTTQKSLPLELRFRTHDYLFGQSALTMHYAEPSVATLHVWSRDHSAFTLDRCLCSVAGVTVGPISKEPSQHQSVRLVINTSVAQLKGIVQGSVRLYASASPTSAYTVKLLLMP